MSKPNRSTLTLAWLGVVCAVVFLLFVALYPLMVHGQTRRLFDVQQLSRDRRWAAVLYGVGLVILFIAYWISLELVRRASVSLRLIVTFALLFGVILIWLYPITAIDLFKYIARARLPVIYGANPLAETLDDYPDDPYRYLTGGWHGNPSPYGPAWALLAAGVVSLGASQAVSGALAFKVLAFLAYIACLALLVRTTNGDPEVVLLFAWNPLVLMQGIGNGHNDLVMLFWVLLSLIVWERKRRWAPAVAAMSLAVLIKASSALMAPLLAVAILREYKGWRRIGVALGSGAVALAVVMLTFIPFWPPSESMEGLLNEIHRSSFSNAPVSTSALDWLLPLDLGDFVITTVPLLILVGVYIYALVRVLKGNMTLAQAGLLVIFVYLLTRSSYRIWYPMWLVPLTALYLTRRSRLRTFLLCITSELSVLILTIVYSWFFRNQPSEDTIWPYIHAITQLVVLGLPLLVPLFVPVTWTGPRKWSILPDRSAKVAEDT